MNIQTIKESYFINFNNNYQNNKLLGNSLNSNSNSNSISNNNNLDSKELDKINSKLDTIQNQLEILKYKEATKHIVHLGVFCDNCKKNNITGIRYRCLTCNNYDICEDCERYLSHLHDNSHFFLRIHDTSLYNNVLLQEQQNQQNMLNQQKY